MIEVIRTEVRPETEYLYCSECRSKVSFKTHKNFYRVIGTSVRMSGDVEFEYCSELCANKGVRRMPFWICMGEFDVLCPDDHSLFVGRHHGEFYEEWKPSRARIVGQVVRRTEEEHVAMRDRRERLHELLEMLSDEEVQRIIDEHKGAIEGYMKM